MKILILQVYNAQSEFELFLNAVSGKLAAAICKKLQAYVEVNAVNMSNSLKILKPKIWGYNGTIYKLRVDCGKESARLMFAKTPQNDIVLLHGFIKKTQKTPNKDAKIAMVNLQRLENSADVTELALAKYIN
ncbi:MAG: type II toxin-antitoxin system RelE/ParE family toxin [Gammaproteobacteria bacterium]|nr:type II toxin-antitoxin system RelE/ParE family toxin [Gammaproteobacteria bacterium]